MKFLIISLLVFTSVSAFTSEREGMSACESYGKRAEIIQSELTKISYEIARDHSGPEESQHSSSSSSGGSFNCEEGTNNHQSLVSRRDKLESELKEVRKNQRAACGRVYPE